jgi:hypothetical protein
MTTANVNSFNVKYLARVRYIFLLILFIVFHNYSAFAGTKTDTVYFKNGNKLTCEVKRLYANLLHVSTSDAGNIDIKWDKIDSLYIKQYMVIILEDGERILGTFIPGDTTGNDGIAGVFGIKFIPHLSIIQMYQYKKIFWKRMSGRLSTGASYVKATGVGAVEFDGKLKYSTEQNIIDSKYNAYWSRYKKEDISQRHNVSLNYYRILRNRYFYTALVSLEKNSELGLDLRSNVGLGYGNNIIFNNKSLGFAAAGIQINNERGQDSTQNNAEGIFVLSYSLFILSSPKISFDFSFELSQNLKDIERTRLAINSNLKWEIISDFYIKYNFYYAFDSKPLSETASKKDWSTSIGIEFAFN